MDLQSDQIGIGGILAGAHQELGIGIEVRRVVIGVDETGVLGSNLCGGPVEQEAVLCPYGDVDETQGDHPTDMDDTTIVSGL